MGTAHVLGNGWRSAGRSPRRPRRAVHRQGAGRARAAVSGHAGPMGSPRAALAARTLAGDAAACHPAPSEAQPRRRAAQRRYAAGGCENGPQRRGAGSDAHTTAAGSSCQGHREVRRTPLLNSPQGRLATVMSVSTSWFPHATTESCCTTAKACGGAGRQPLTWRGL